MAKKEQLRDLVIILPGILGSVLRKDGKDLWSVGRGARIAGTCLTGLNFAALDQLQLGNDDPTLDDVGDGIEANRLITVPHCIAGLSKIDGYTALRALITDHFQVMEGDPNEDSPGNFFEFPYDWRRDNRVAARRLQRFVGKHLQLWREYSGATDAKVILLAHSMGGLIARYYLEVLEGWQDCRALVTFGTPYRGSVKAVDFLANGYKQVFLELTEVVRSFTSVYQLMPIYEMIKVNGRYQRISETNQIPNIDQVRAAQALAFHREIEASVNAHTENDQYFRLGYKTIPIVGVRQDTLQSAGLSDGRFIVDYSLPDHIEPSLGDGDGTVPRISAIPIELDREFRETYIAEQHSYLQSNNHVLNNLRERLKQMQATHQPIRGSELSQEALGQAAINLNLDDLYLRTEPVMIRAKLLNVQENPGILTAAITSVDKDENPIKVELAPHDHQYLAAIDSLESGIYRVSVQSRRQGPSDPLPVHDLFEVVN
jgi:pimeloyl-ACP methyl ester carboxylesterase